MEFPAGVFFGDTFQERRETLVAPTLLRVPLTLPVAASSAA